MLASHAKVNAHTFGMAPWSQNETRMSNPTPKQLRFVEEYLIDLIATQAARRAGYKGKYINRTASELLDKTRHLIEPRLGEQRATLAKKTELTRERWLKELTCVAFNDPGKMFDNHGNPLEICEMPQHVRRAIASFDIVETFEGKAESRRAVGYTRRFKCHDKIAALKHIGEVMGFAETPAVPAHLQSMQIVFVSKPVTSTPKPVTPR